MFPERTRAAPPSKNSIAAKMAAQRAHKLARIAIYAQAAKDALNNDPGATASEAGAAAGAEETGSQEVQ